MERTYGLVADVPLSKEARIDRNIPFLKWLYSKVKKGYLPLANVGEMQELIDEIRTCYEVKYPTFLIESGHVVSQTIRPENLDILKRYLNDRQRELLSCNYRMANAHNFQNHTIKVRILDYEGKEYYLTARDTDGVIIQNMDEFDLIYAPQVSTLEEALDIFTESPFYDESDLRRVVATHEYDRQVRSALLKMVTYNLQKFTYYTPSDAGFWRANLWLREVSLYLGVELSELAIPKDMSDDEYSDTYSREKKSLHLQQKIASREARLHGETKRH